MRFHRGGWVLLKLLQGPWGVSRGCKSLQSKLWLHFKSGREIKGPEAISSSCLGQAKS